MKCYDNNENPGNMGEMTIQQENDVDYRARIEILPTYEVNGTPRTTREMAKQMDKEVDQTERNEINETLAPTKERAMSLDKEDDHRQRTELLSSYERNIKDKVTTEF